MKKQNPIEKGQAMDAQNAQGQARYVNPYTDFGFKKLFGTAMNKDLQERVFEKLFKQADIARFTPNYPLTPLPNIPNYPPNKSKNYKSA